MDLEFKVGQPYLMRHSTRSKSISTLIDTGEDDVKLGTCDHFFSLSDLRMASYPLDLPLLEQTEERDQPPSLPIYIALTKHKHCELCESNLAFASIIYSTAIKAQKKPGDELYKAPPDVQSATLVCEDCYNTVVKGTEHQCFPYYFNFNTV